MLPLAAHPLVHVNASLNSLATVLLVVGLILIKQRKEAAHKRVMLSAFVVSVVFLACYLYYHIMLQLQTPFGGEGIARYIYFAILISHVLLAMAVPPLAITSIVFGLWAHGDRLPRSLQGASDTAKQGFITRARASHRRWARITFPIWLYVSVTGVVVYVMLYHLYVSE